MVFDFSSLMFTKQQTGKDLYDRSFFHKEEFFHKKRGKKNEELKSRSNLQNTAKCFNLKF